MGSVATPAAAVGRYAVRIGCIRLRRSGRADDPRIFLPVSWRLSAHASDPAVAHSLIGHWCSAARGRRVLLLATGRFWGVLAGRHAHGCQPGCQQGCKTEKPQRFHYIAPIRINCEPGTREGCRRCATLTPFGWPQRRAADSALLGAQEPDRLHRVSAAARGIEPHRFCPRVVISIALVGAAPVERLPGPFPPDGGTPCTRPPRGHSGSEASARTGSHGPAKSKRLGKRRYGRSRTSGSIRPGEDTPGGDRGRRVPRVPSLSAAQWNLPDASRSQVGAAIPVS